MRRRKKTIGILTGGGDVPGLNPAIRAITIRAIQEGYRVIGIRRGWEGLVTIQREKNADNSCCYQVLNEEAVNRVGRSGGTFLHSSRTRPSHIPRSHVPAHLKDKFNEDVNDLTPEVLANLDYLNIDYLIPIGGDDTLSYAVHLAKQGVKIVAMPKTMDNDVPGTDYCIGFSTAVTRIIEMTHNLRTTAGSHERFLVIEVFGRYAGFTAVLPTMAGAANRCVIPEAPFDMERLAEILMEDRYTNPSKYSVVIVSEGAKIQGEKMVFKSEEKDMYGHKKLGGIGDYISMKLKELSPKFTGGKPINTVNQRLGYLIRCGNPDAIDSIVPMAFGNLALDLILKGRKNRLVGLRKGMYDDVPLDIITSYKKVVDVDKYYNAERFRPKYKSFESKPLLIMTSDL